MSTKRQTISPEKKFKIVVEILRSQQTLNEIASKYKVHPTLITRWKKHFFESGPSLFLDGRRKIARDDRDEKIEQLCKIIGQQEYDIEWLKKNTELSIEQRRDMIEPSNPKISIDHQCELLGLGRSTFYYQPWVWNEAALKVMKVIDEVFTQYPFYGKRTIKIISQTKSLLKN